MGRRATAILFPGFPGCKCSGLFWAAGLIYKPGLPRAAKARKGRPFPSQGQRGLKLLSPQPPGALRPWQGRGRPGYPQLPSVAPPAGLQEGLEEPG